MMLPNPPVNGVRNKWVSEEGIRRPIKAMTLCFSDSASLCSPLRRMKECVGNKRLTSLDMIGLIEGSGSAAMQHHFFVGLCSVRPFSKNPCFCTDIAMNYSCFYCVSINWQMSICEHSREKQSILNEGWIGATPNKRFTVFCPIGVKPVCLLR